MSVRPLRLARSVPRSGTHLGKNVRPDVTGNRLEPMTPDLFRSIRARGKSQNGASDAGRAELRQRRRRGETARAQRKARQQLKAMYR